MKKKRLDEVLIENGFVSDRDDAFVKVTEGLVFVDGQKAVSPAQPVGKTAKIEVHKGFTYVGRGAFKLEAALREFRISPLGKICVDIGSATGGFVEILLKYGAKKVYAIDTAKGKLALKLREDPRVKVFEGYDVRDIRELPQRAELVTIDVSLISLQEILSAARRFLAPDGSVIALFKPQYETRDPRILKHGVVRTAEARQKLLNDFMSWAGSDWTIVNWMESPVRGSEGNVEYLLWLRLS